MPIVCPLDLLKRHGRDSRMAQLLGLITSMVGAMKDRRCAICAPCGPDGTGSPDVARIAGPVDGIQIGIAMPRV